MSKAFEVHPMMLALIVALLVSGLTGIAFINVIVLMAYWTIVAFVILYVLVWLFHRIVVRRRGPLRA